MELGFPLLLLQTALFLGRVLPVPHATRPISDGTSHLLEVVPPMPLMPPTPMPTLFPVPQQERGMELGFPLLLLWALFLGQVLPGPHAIRPISDYTYYCGHWWYSRLLGGAMSPRPTPLRYCVLPVPPRERGTEPRAPWCLPPLAVGHGRPRPPVPGRPSADTDFAPWGEAGGTQSGRRKVRTETGGSALGPSLVGRPVPAAVH